MLFCSSSSPFIASTFRHDDKLPENLFDASADRSVEDVEMKDEKDIAITEDLDIKKPSPADLPQTPESKEDIDVPIDLFVFI